MTEGFSEPAEVGGLSMGRKLYRPLSHRRGRPDPEEGDPPAMTLSNVMQ